MNAEKKILVKRVTGEDDFKIVCDCTNMNDVNDAKFILDYFYSGIYPAEFISEVATSLGEEGEYSDDDVIFKVIDISSLENPLKALA